MPTKFFVTISAQPNELFLGQKQIILYLNVVGENIYENTVSCANEGVLLTIIKEIQFRFIQFFCSMKR